MGILLQDTVISAFSLGYRHVDTAAIYQNQKGVGAATCWNRGGGGGGGRKANLCELVGFLLSWAASPARGNEKGPFGLLRGLGGYVLSPSTLTHSGASVGFENKAQFQGVFISLPCTHRFGPPPPPPPYRTYYNYSRALPLAEEATSTLNSKP